MQASALSAHEDVTVDVVGECTCCYNGLTLDEFLMMFGEHLPEHGRQTFLRIHGGAMGGVGMLFQHCGNGH